MNMPIPIISTVQSCEDNMKTYKYNSRLFREQNLCNRSCVIIQLRDNNMKSVLVNICDRYLNTLSLKGEKLWFLSLHPHDDLLLRRNTHKHAYIIRWFCWFLYVIFKIHLLLSIWSFRWQPFHMLWTHIAPCLLAHWHPTHCLNIDWSSR